MHRGEMGCTRGMSNVVEEVADTRADWVLQVGTGHSVEFVVEADTAIGYTVPLGGK